MNMFELVFNESPQVINVTFNETTQKLDLGFTDLQVIHIRDVDPYTGEYECTPCFEDCCMETKNKIMLDNLIIHSIPCEETTNPEGGLTLNIGG